jgi:predicted adenylyl cyclase CyaB
MKNLEIKARNVDHSYIRRVLVRMKGEKKGILHQTDTYFKVPKGRFKLRDEKGKGAYAIYYERGEKAAQRWSIYHTLVVSKPKDFRIFMQTTLGVRVEVVKKRELWLWKNARIHLDTVKALGTFIEIEVVVRKGEAQAQRIMDDLLAEFRISRKDFIRKSYSDLLLKN